MKDKKTSIIEWVSAGIITLFLANFLCFFYYNPSHGSEHNSYRLEPDMVGLDATEGFGILYSDKNGFPNKNIPLVDNGYILCMGSSFTKGDQVLIDDRWPSIIGDAFGDSEFLYTYNLGYNGGSLENIVKNFKQLINEFPDSAAVIIELDDSTMIWSKEQYLNAMNQLEPADVITGTALKKHNIVGKIKLFIKTYCPLLLLYYEQFIQFINRVEFSPFFQEGEIIAKLNVESSVDVEEQCRNVDETMEGEEQCEDIEEITEIEEQYKNALGLIKGQYTGELIIIYHPRIRIDEADMLGIEKAEEVAIFEKVCNENEITFLDMTDDFIEAFKNENILPYGFWNTTMGEGHFNKEGNKLMANKILDYLQLEEK